MNPTVVAFALAALAGAAVSTTLSLRRASPEFILDPSSGFSHAATEIELPRGEGRSLIERRCATCHALGLIMQQRLSPEAWKAEVKKMRGWGAFMDDAEAAAITDVLVSNLGRDSPRYLPALLDPKEAEGPTRGEVANGPPGDRAHGAELYKLNCAPCHGAEAEGARGPALRERPIASQPLRFATAVRSGRGDMPGYPSFDVAAVADLFAFVAAP